MGRAGKLALSELRVLEHAGKGAVKIDAVQRNALEILLERYRTGIPRTINVSTVCKPYIVFTDGACEEQGDDFLATIGGILFDPEKLGEIETFGCRVEPSVLASWKSAGKQHPVALTELYAVCVAKFIWRNRLDGARCIWFVDNQSVVDALIKGYSNDGPIKTLLLGFEHMDAAFPSFHWFARVPSSSNPSDLPSRGKFSELCKIIRFCRRCEARCPLTKQALSDFDVAEENGEIS